jgi:hypothetical protein
MSLNEDAEGVVAPVQGDDREPDASDAQANQPGTDTEQDDSHFDVVAREAALDERLTGVAPKDEAPEPPAEKTAPTAPPSKPTPGKPIATEKVAPQTAPVDANNPPDERENTEPDPSEQELERYHPSARRHVRRLLSERRQSREEMTKLSEAHKADRQVVDQLLDSAERNGLPVERIPHAAAAFGRAFMARDAQAQQALYDDLVKAGFKGPSAAGPDVTAAVKAALADYEQNFDVDRAVAVATQAAPSRRNEAPPAATPAPRDQRQEAAPSPVSQDVARRVQAGVDEQDRRIADEVGHENAKAVGDRVLARLRDDLEAAKSDPAVFATLPRLMKVAVDSELAAIRQRKAVPPRVARSSSETPAAVSDIARREAALDRRLLGG